MLESVSSPLHLASELLSELHQSRHCGNWVSPSLSDPPAPILILGASLYVVCTSFWLDKGEIAKLGTRNYSIGSNDQY